MENKITKNSLYKAEIIDVSSSGDGICKLDDGFVIFVPNSVKGDILNIKIVKLLKNYGYGKIENIISPSKYRVKSDCDISTRCGGCCFRHIDYEYECTIKKQFVIQAFSKIAKVNNILIDDTIKSASELYYRNKAQYPLGLSSDNIVIAGFYAKRSHNIVKLNNCFLQPIIFNDILNDIIYFITKYNISIYDEFSKVGLIRHVYIRKADFTNEIMVCIVSTSSDIKNIDILVDILLNKYKDIKSIVININDNDTNIILGNKNIILYGNEYIYDVICGIKIKISVNSFYQINKLQAEKLYLKAIECAKLNSNDILLDLYCGIGTISLIAAKYVKKVIGIEVVSQAVDDANYNADINNIHNAEFICSDAKTASLELTKIYNNIDVVILDPPRKGCDIIVLNSILNLSPKKIIMISCNPSTAARDCKYLLDNDYNIEEIVPFDMFPRTNHVECVVLMSRK